MGQDKALLDWVGRPLIQHVADQVRSLGTQVDDLTIVGFRPGYDVAGVAIVEDDYPGKGALGGIATALRAARHERVLVVACDMPLLNTRLLRAMIEISGACAGVVVPVLAADRSRQGGRQTFETLHAIYHRNCLTSITRNLKAGNVKIADALGDLPICALDEAWIRSYDPDLMSFFNVNIPEQFAAAREYARSVDERELDENQRRVDW